MNFLSYIIESSSIPISLILFSIYKKINISEIFCITSFLDKFELKTKFKFSFEIYFKLYIIRFPKFFIIIKKNLIAFSSVSIFKLFCKKISFLIALNLSGKLLILKSLKIPPSYFVIYLINI